MASKEAVGSKSYHLMGATSTRVYRAEPPAAKVCHMHSIFTKYHRVSSILIGVVTEPHKPDLGFATIKHTKRAAPLYLCSTYTKHSRKKERKGEGKQPPCRLGSMANSYLGIYPRTRICLPERHVVRAMMQEHSAHRNQSSSRTCR